jgi:hypothetical protein
LQIVGYLRDTPRIGKKDGFNTRKGVTSQDSEFSKALLECNKYRKSLQTVVSLALTYKRLTAVAQGILFRDVSLPQIHPARQERMTPVVSWLRTQVRGPDLARLVEQLAVWLLKDKPIYIPKQAIGPLLLHNVPSGWNLRFLDIYWPDGSQVGDIRDEPEYAVSVTGVKVRVWHLRKTLHTFG